MAKISKLTMLLLILLIICTFSQRLQAETSIYVFSSDQSTVVKTGGFTGVHETYAVTGQFRLTIDSDADVASFEIVDANLADETGLEYGRSLNEIFNMTGLAGTIIDDTTIQFDGKTADGTESDVRLKLTFREDSSHLTGKTTPPPNSADMFFYDVNAVAAKKYSGGTGEPNNPYLIYTAEQLNTIGAVPNDWDKHFKLMADIDLAGYSYDRAVIAPDVNDATYSSGGAALFEGTPFTGVFDGNDHIISNLHIQGSGYLGLFGQLSYKASISNLGLEAVDINGTSDYVGSLVGSNRFMGWETCRGRITNCHSIGTVSGRNSVGGLVGYNSGLITDSYSNTSVLGTIVVGGLVGENSQFWSREGGTISNCYSTGTVSGKGLVGGLVGQNGAWVVGAWEMLAFDGYIDNCYSACNVTGTAIIGGLVGLNEFGAITQCYSNGIVSGKKFIGGLIGQSKARVTVCFWDVETSGLTFSAAGIGKTTAEMQTSDTFISWGACGPFWTIEEGRDYPHLAWENVPGELINAPTYGGGKGTAQDPYLIYTAEELNMLGLSFCDWDKHFKLMANIDLSDFRYGKALIAQGGWWERTPFEGVFDGNGHNISNLNIVGEDNLGLFGFIGPGAEVRDLGILDVNIIGSDIFVGALAGYCKGNLTRCYSSGIVSGAGGVGGMVGSSWESINQCHSSCIVTGGDATGGLVGSNARGNIADSYSTGEVSGGRSVGGLVGRNSGVIIHCYSTDTVSGNGSIGGLVGYNSGGSITDSLWDKQRSGQYDMCGGQSPEASGCSNAYGKTTAEMQTASMFINTGWDFMDETANGTEDIWWMPDDDYPRLWWETAE